MPNNITNQICFGTGKKAEAAFKKALEDLRPPGGPLGAIDFNALIPMPESLNILSGSDTRRGIELYRLYLHEKSIHLKDFEKVWEQRIQSDPDLWELGKQAYENTQKYGVPTWYEWCTEHWGTKWNAYNCQILNPTTVQFQTAWNSVPLILTKLSRKYPDRKIRYCWADEDIGCYVGQCTYKNGSIIQQNIPKNYSVEAYRMAAKILDVDLRELQDELKIVPTRTKKRAKSKQQER